MAVRIFPEFIERHYEIHQWRHSVAILRQEYPNEFDDICGVLTEFRLNRSYIAKGGGNESPVSKWLGSELKKKGWVKKQFQTSIKVDQHDMESPTHEIDCFKNEIALEIEWNNKDPFYDRDLNNFRLLFDLRVVSVGIIVTRCDELQEVFVDLGRGSSFGASTTHMSKLLPKVKGGGGGGCPLLIFGIRRSLYAENF